SASRGSGARASRSSSPRTGCPTTCSWSPHTRRSSTSTSRDGRHTRCPTPSASRSSASRGTMSTPDVDDQLRRAVAELAAREGCAWAAIYFVEDDELVLGPEAGLPDPSRRTTVPVLWSGTRVAELAADGTVD